MKNAYRVTQKGETSDRLYNPKRSAHNNKSSKHRAQNGTKIWNWQMCKIFGPFNTTILEFEKLSKKRLERCGRFGQNYETKHYK